MIDSVRPISTNAFARLAGAYQENRPGYPNQLLSVLAERARSQVEQGAWTADFLAIDVGAGTGISTRQLAGALSLTCQVVGIEPNTEMLQEARAGGGPPNLRKYLDGTAENLPFDAGTASLVVAAQAVQWFDRPRYYAEALRVLRPVGIIAVIQNNRSWECSAFLDHYEDLLERYSPGYTREYRDIDFLTEFEVAGFAHCELHQCDWVRAMSVPAFIGMAKSSTKFAAAVQTHGEDVVLGALIHLIKSAKRDEDLLPIRYHSELFMAWRPL
jgi:ubiquinone/menaquinone biosynthesis C-methylase UbiE